MSHDTTSELPADLLDLLGGLVNGTLDELHVRRLELILLADPRARAVYRRYMNLHAALQRTAATSRGVSLRRELQSLFDADAGNDCETIDQSQLLADSLEGMDATLSDAMILPAMTGDEEAGQDEEIIERCAEPFAPPAALPPLWRWDRWWSGRGRAAIIALPLLIGIGAVIAVLHHPSAPAQLGSCIGAAWDAPYVNLAVGEQMPEGSVHLLSGLAEVHFKNGVALALQGPARFEVRGEKLVVLSEGKLTALVPHTAIGFTVETPTARVVDLGTEFGVGVADGQQTHVEVFQGQIRAELPARTGTSAVTQILSANDAVDIGRGAASIQAASPTPLAFVRVDEIRRRAAGAEALAVRWHAASENLRNDPATVAYYTFDNAKEAAGRLLNRASATAGQFDGQLGTGQPGADPHWAVGRWPGKGALEFDGARNTVVILPPIPQFVSSHAVSVAAWVMPRHPLRSQYILNEMRGKTDRVNLVWLGNDIDYQPKSSIYFDRGGGKMLAEGILPQESRWTFIVVTGDAQGVGRFYLDGIERAAVAGALRIGSDTDHGLQIGSGWRNWKAGLPFDGLIDEVALMNRVLSPGEIRALYDAGKPDTDNTAAAKQSNAALAPLPANR